MASGVTNEMKALSRIFGYRTQEPREQRERDRSLNGKARIKARRANRTNS